MERKINETFNYDGKTYKVVKDDQRLNLDCPSCAFRKHCNHGTPEYAHIKYTVGACSSRDRTDNTDVHFELISDSVFAIKPTYIPFDIELAQSGTKVVLKGNHQEVRILAYTLKNAAPILAAVPNGCGGEDLWSYYKDGKCTIKDDDATLMLEIPKRVGYVIISNTGICSGRVYTIKEYADSHAEPGDTVCEVLF